MTDFDYINELPTFAEISHPPGRSLLFSLAPAQFGKPMQESLISLIVRISRAHAVSPRRLVFEVLGLIDPEVASACYPGFFKSFSRTINGLGQYAELFVSVVEKSTLVGGLCNLTMNPWQGLFPHNGHGMLAEHPRWCPDCLYQQQFSSDGTYFPLAWALEAFKICPLHDRRMEEYCPHCLKRQPFVPRFPDQGICNECSRPLVSYGGLAERHRLTPATAFEKWVSNAVIEMIVRHTDNGKVPNLKNFRDFLLTQVKLRSDGNCVALCREIGFPERALKGWMSKGEKPSISSLLGLCYALRIAPTDIISGISPHPGFSPTSRGVEKVKRRAPRPQLDCRRREVLGRQLAEQLHNDECLPVSKVAQDIGISARSLRYWFPDICAKLSARYRLAANLRSRSYQVSQACRVEEIVRQLKVSGEYPSRRKVSEIIRKESMSLAQPYLLQAFRRALLRQ